MRWTLLALCLFACGTPTEPAMPLAQGWWTSANGWALHVEAAKVSVSAGCFYGAFATPRLDRHGAFDADGTFGGGGGPPPLPGYVPPPAHFAGTLRDGQLTLTVTQQNGTVRTPPAFTFDGAQPLHPIASPCP